MSFADNVTDKLNQLESFAENSPPYLFALKLLAWLLLFLALIVTNRLALIVWPFSAISKLVRSESQSLNSTVSKSFAVRGLPTLIIFRKGIEFKRSSGTMTASQISDLIEEARLSVNNS